MSELALKLIKENRRHYEAGDSACKRLELGRCGLREIPQEVFELVWLEELIVSNGWSDYEIDWSKSIVGGAVSQNMGGNNSLSIIPSGLQRLKKLKFLRLGGGLFDNKWEINKIQHLPEGLIHLDLCNNQIKRIENLPAGLKYLYIGDNNVSQIENLPAELTKLNIFKNQIKTLENLPERLTFLFIGDNKIHNLENLPDGLVHLYIGGNQITRVINLPDSLKYLIIAGNKISTIENLPDGIIMLSLHSNQISKIENLPNNLLRLNIDSNKISRLENLPNCLNELQIHGNQIPKLENLPEGLTKLYIGSNQISRLENLPNRLKHFSISFNKISRLENLPDGLTQLDIRANQITRLENLPSSIRELNIGNNKIYKLENLPHYIRQLFIENNQISMFENLPSDLNQLKISSNDISIIQNMPSGLKELEIHHNQIFKIENLPQNLKLLDVSFNHISKIEKLPQGLKKLNMSYNEISRIENLPTELFVLEIFSNLINRLENLPAGLNKLYISDNQISKIENLPPNLIHLDIRFNKVEELSPIKDWLVQKRFRVIWETSLEDFEIAVRGNPFTTPPPEIVRRGNDAVIEYFKKLEKEKVKLHESKLLIVGQGEVGKTWLMQRLITGKTPENGKTTEGIDIRSRHFDNQDIKDFRVNFWDFGGQEIYHATHQFFLTKRSLYLFVWDARKEQDIITSFDYWLNVISLLSRQSPVIVVMNKCDERTKAIEEETLKKRFGNIIAFHKVSALDGTGIEALKADLVKHITALPHVGSELPKVWNDIRLELEGLGKNSISLKEYNEICGRHGLSPKEAEFSGDYYHDVGVFLHFRDNAILRDIIFLNPEWATNAVYKIIDTKDVQKALGHFDYDKLKEIWQEYDEDKYKYLLELMKRFELCFQIGNSGHYIVPELLRPEYPELEWDYAENLRFELRYDFMPAGIVTRLITRRNHHIKDGICWRNGLVIERNNSEALIISDAINRKISIWIRGDERKEMLFLIRDEIDQIHETLNFPIFTAMYPCICSECKDSATPQFFESPDVVNLILKKKITIQCRKSGEDVNIEELRGSIMSNTDFAYDAILSIGRTNQEMLNKIIEMLTVIKSNQPDKDTVLDDFFKIVPMNLGVINAGELLKKLLRFRKERLDFRKD